jgi:hypothetical protein
MTNGSFGQEFKAAWVRRKADSSQGAMKKLDLAMLGIKNRGMKS